MTIINQNAYPAVVDIPITLDAGTYYMSVLSASVPAAIYRDGAWFSNGVSDNSKKSTIKIMDGGLYVCRITAEAQSTATVNELMISAKDVPYEPYTGGKPAPSPEYPQEIVSKTVDQIVVTGKNLINQPTLSFTHFTKIDLTNPLRPDTYTFSGVATTAAESDALLISCLDDAGKLVVSVYLPVDGRKHHTVSVSRRVAALQIYAARSNALAIGKNAQLQDLQIELGSVATPYEPYHAQTVTLSAPVTLRGVPVTSGGNVTISGKQYMADRITERDGVVGIERRTKRLELPVADMNNSESSPGWNRKGFTENLSNPVYSVSTHLPKNSISLNFKYDILFFHASGLTASEWKSKHPDVVIGAVVTLEAPTFEPLPETDQQAIRELRTYHGNTVVTTGAHTEVDYIADPKLYIDGKVTSLVTAYMQSIPVTIPMLDEEVVENDG